MRKYSKAHYLKDLRKFDGWKEKERPADEEPLEDDSIVYLQDNFTVVRDVFDEEDYIFDDVSEEWKTFCREQLDFEIPEDLRYAYEDEDEGEGEEGAAEGKEAAAASAD